MKCEPFAHGSKEFRKYCVDRGGVADAAGLIPNLVVTVEFPIRTSARRAALLINALCVALDLASQGSIDWDGVAVARWPVYAFAYPLTGHRKPKWEIVLDLPGDGRQIAKRAAGRVWANLVDGGTLAIVRSGPGDIVRHVRRRLDHPNYRYKTVLYPRGTAPRKSRRRYEAAQA